MRVVLYLCDRCRAEMPTEGADPGRLRIRLDLPVPKRALRRAPEPPMLELCQGCRDEFAGWLADAGASVPGLTPAPAKTAMPPTELPEPASPESGSEDFAEADAEVEEEDLEAEPEPEPSPAAQAVVLAVGGGAPPPPANAGKGPRRSRSG